MANNFDTATHAVIGTLGPTERRRAQKELHSTQAIVRLVACPFGAGIFAATERSDLGSCGDPRLYRSAAGRSHSIIENTVSGSPRDSTAFLCRAFGMIACESDDKKLARLESERQTACGAAIAEFAELEKVDSSVDPGRKNLFAIVAARQRGDTIEANSLEALDHAHLKKVCRKASV